MYWSTNSIVLAVAGLMLAGCGAGSSAANTTQANAAAPANPTVSEPAATPSAAPATGAREVGEPASVTLAGVADDALPGVEAPEADLLGTWEVVDVSSDASASAGAVPDRSIVGSRLSYTTDLLGWTAADGTIATQGSCPDASYTILQTAAVARDMGKAFRPAWAKFGVASADVGAPHSWDCDTADPVYFGPHGGAVFYPVRGGRMVMEWDKQRILLLRRVPA